MIDGADDGNDEYVSENDLVMSKSQWRNALEDFFMDLEDVNEGRDALLSTWNDWKKEISDNKETYEDRHIQGYQTYAQIMSEVIDQEP